MCSPEPEPSQQFCCLMVGMPGAYCEKDENSPGKCAKRGRRCVAANPWLEFLSYWSKRGHSMAQLRQMYEDAKNGNGFLIGPPHGIRYGENDDSKERLCAYHRHRKIGRDREARLRSGRRVKVPRSLPSGFRDVRRKQRTVLRPPPNIVPGANFRAQAAQFFNPAVKSNLRAFNELNKKVDALKKIVQILKPAYKNLKPVSDTVDIEKRPDMIRKMTLFTGRISSDHRACMRFTEKTVDGVRKVLGTLSPGPDAKKEDMYKILFEGTSALGSGENGVAYATKSNMFLPSAIKIAARTEENMRESVIGMQISRSVVRRSCPNFLCTLGYAVCNEPGVEGIAMDKRLFGKIRNEGGYVVTIMELANGGTLGSWIDANRGLHVFVWASMVLQMLLALRTLHYADRTHSDAHAGNFLVDKVAEGTLHYRLPNHHLYVPTHGSLLVLCDFGWVLPLNDIGTVVEIDDRRALYNGGLRGDLVRVFNPWTDCDEPLIRMLAEKMLDIVEEEVFRTWPDGTNMSIVADTLINDFVEEMVEWTGLDFRTPPDDANTIINKHKPYNCKMPGKVDYTQELERHRGNLHVEYW